MAFRSILPWAVAALLLAAPAGADDAQYRLKPGARGKLCTGCHADFADVLTKTSVHAPVKSGKCSDCHDPHASDHGKLLGAGPREICLTCHASLLPDRPKSVHEVVLAGECTTCHDPHASTNPKLLLTAGNALCLTCHSELAEAIAAAQYKHSPVQKNCLTCHDPHASAENASMLVRDEGSLCGSCHKPDQPTFVKAHGNYPVAKARCTSCHDPHGSSKRGSLWASVHPPVASGQCTQCHNEATSSAPLATKKSGLDVCRPCHADVVGRTFTAKRTHWPVVDGTGCVNCHSPHAAKQPGLLREKTATLCYECHADTRARQALNVTKHEPTDAGDCTTCHDPHASEGTFLMAEGSVIETCGNCHDWKQHTSHPLGQKILDPRNPNLELDCESCHLSHGAKFPHLAPFNADADLCVQCHASMRR